jgi:hypothetical protein
VSSASRKINRAPVLTLWAAVVAERLGGVSLGLFHPAPEAVREHRKKPQKGKVLSVALLGRAVPVEHTPVRDFGKQTARSPGRPGPKPAQRHEPAAPAALAPSAARMLLTLLTLETARVGPEPARHHWPSSTSRTPRMRESGVKGLGRSLAPDSNAPWRRIVSSA